MAIILPFRRPSTLQKPAGVRPPLAIRYGEYGVNFFGSREQLTAWGIVSDDQFPIPPKRTIYHASRDREGAVDTWVEAYRKGLYRVRLCGDPLSENVVDRIAKRIERASDAQHHGTAAAIRALNAWSSAMIRSDGYDAGLWDAMQKPFRAFELAAVELALHYKPADVAAIGTEG